MHDRNLGFDDYVQLVRRSGLIEKDRLQQVVDQFQQTQDVSDGRTLAQHLVDAEVLTGWQTKHLLAGRCQGFFLSQYKLLDVVGTGGMGTVYVAEHVMMKRKVAIKVLSEAAASDANVERFMIECQAIAALDHANVVRAFDFNRHGKFLYLVMEYVDGPDLNRYVTQCGGLTETEAAEYVRQAAAGLAHAHAAGIVHRDVKPANLLKNPQNIIKVTDLGLARMSRGALSLTLSSGQDMMGTIDYLAPEQATNSHACDERADIYGLGCSLYFLISGKRPYEGTPVQVLMAHQAEESVRLDGVRSDVSRPLVEICHRMMAADPDVRPQTMGSVHDELQQWLSTQSTMTIRPPQPAAAPELVAPPEPLTIAGSGPLSTPPISTTPEPAATQVALNTLDQVAIELIVRELSDHLVNEDDLTKCWQSSAHAERELIGWLESESVFDGAVRQTLRMVKQGYLNDVVLLGDQERERLLRLLGKTAATSRSGATR